LREAGPSGLLRSGENRAVLLVELPDEEHVGTQDHGGVL